MVGTDTDHPTLTYKRVWSLIDSWEVRYTGWDKGDYYSERWQYWAPWNVTNPWLPRMFRGGDEYCNPSVVIVLPLLGAFVWFYKRGPLRTEPCDECEVCRLCVDVESILSSLPDDDPGDNPWGGASLEQCGDPDCGCAN